MQHFQKNTALGSEVQLVLVTADKVTADSLFSQLWQRIFVFERQFSRFLPGSELSKFNRAAGVKQQISPEFIKLLRVVKDMSQKTGGLYNPFILPALQSAGYGASMVKGHEKDVYDDYSGRAVAAAAKLQIGDDWASIPYGTAIDLGGCGKGYLADQLADFIEERVNGYWFSLGGDIIAGGDAGSEPWKIGIQDAQAPSKDIARVEAVGSRRLSVASSGTTVRKGSKGNKAWHHLIDPRTLKPADTDVLLATVCGTSCLHADILASCAVILGTTKAPDFLRKQGVQNALMQSRQHNSQLGKLIRVNMDKLGKSKHNKRHKFNYV